MELFILRFVACVEVLAAIALNPHHPCYHDCHPVTAVPEPSTWLLIIVGLALLVLWSRRAKR